MVLLSLLVALSLRARVAAAEQMRVGEPRLELAAEDPVRKDGREERVRRLHERREEPLRREFKAPREVRQPPFSAKMTLPENFRALASPLDSFK